MNDIPITGDLIWIDDGIVLELNDLIEDYAPNYKAMREWSDYHYKDRNGYWKNGRNAIRYLLSG